MIDKELLDIFKSLGFVFYKTTNTSAGSSDEFKYYPDYLDDSHYTLVTFKHKNNITHQYGTEFRLYRHKNVKGSFIESPFQITNSNHNSKYITEKIDVLFINELRDIKLNKILYESSL